MDEISLWRMMSTYLTLSEEYLFSKLWSQLLQLNFIKLMEIIFPRYWSDHSETTTIFEIARNGLTNLIFLLS